MRAMNSLSGPVSAFTPIRVGVVGFDEVTAFHFIGSAQAFAAAKLDDGYGGLVPCYEVRTIGVCSDRFEAEGGLITFEAPDTLALAPELDTIIIPGGRGIRRPKIQDKIAKWIVKRLNDTRRIGTVCTGIYGLAPTGLLDGRQVTTHWRFARDLGERFPRLKIDHRKPFVQDGPYYTVTGLNGGVNLALAMIKEDYGPHVARSVEDELLLRLTQDQGDELTASAPSWDNRPMERFSDLMAWIMRNLHADLSVEVLARRVCMCPSHFSKVFKSIFGEPPRDFVDNLRLNEAHRRLSKQQKTVGIIAQSVGFTDSMAFQEAFERKFGCRPGRYFEGRQTKTTALSNGHLNNHHDIALAKAS